MPESKTYNRSLSLFEKARELIPSCTQTFSKGYTQYPYGVSPLFLEKADGCHVWDVDGNKFVDWPMALGPVVLGHNYGPVNQAVQRQLDRGVAFSLPHAGEVELAERLCDLIPCAEMVRFGKNGSDATAGAVRAARAYTGRDMVACCGYHGWQDWYIGTTARHLGVPQTVRDLTKTFEYNNADSLAAILDRYPGQIACVILEPVGLVAPRGRFLETVNGLAHKNGALVIYDECWTGFRWSPGGAQSFFGVTPDLACFGKALGNGFPISAIVGPREIMAIFDEIFFSFTFGGDAVGIAAALAVLKELERTDAIARIWETGGQLKSGVEDLIQEHGLKNRIRITGYPPKTFVSFLDGDGGEDLVLKSVVQQEMIRLGFLYAGYHAVSLSHSRKEIELTLSAYGRVFSRLGNDPDADELKRMLRGRPVEPVFRQQPAAEILGQAPAERPY